MLTNKDKERLILIDEEFKKLEEILTEHLIRVGQTRLEIHNLLETE